MRALFVTSEVFPLCKTGGLADVSAALPVALGELGIDIRVMLPGYPQALAAAVETEILAELPALMGCGPVRLVGGLAPDSGIPLLLVDCPALYDRPGGLYLAPDGGEWPDNALRFGLLNHAAALVASGEAGLAWHPQIVHAQDWHTGLIPLLTKGRPGAAPTLFTIHNMAFQGVFPMSAAAALHLPPEALGVDGVEWYGKLSFLKAGLRFSQAVNTVSPNYAGEVLTPAFGCGLDGLLRARGDLCGILNGVDQKVWNPARDPHLPRHYGAEDLSGKAVCKALLQRELGLAADPAIPVFAFVSRLTQQKMAETIAEAVPALVARGAQFALIGNGDGAIEAAFARLAAAHPGQAAIRIGYEEPLAHRIYAGADAMLAPARFEPCGLTPMYAMRYGTVPIVRPVGGLADAVAAADARSLEAGTASGFSFAGDTAAELLACADAVIAAFRTPLRWRRLQLQGMRRDCSWRGPARQYAALYRSLVPDAVDGRPVVARRAAPALLARSGAA